MDKILNQIDSDFPVPVIETGLKDSVFPQLFEAAYFNGTEVSQGSEKYRFSRFSVGNLNVTSGKIIAGDPITLSQAIPFTTEFPIGEFPVELALSENNGFRTVAFSRISFSDAPVSKWEYALQPGQEPISLSDSDFYCFGVDGGMAVFIDAEANKALNSRGQSLLDFMFADISSTQEFQADIYSFESYNLARFSSGYGDGCYATYIGYDSTNQACRLLIDFGLIGWWN
ncbi:MAG: DUF4241 domain-containing protein [Bacteroidetes bacterium]|nr:DUF4241 domain-containing protein [Bacteroidota bacterium]